MSAWALLVLLTPPPPPPPTPQSVREVPACSVELDLPRGAVVVTRICLVRRGRLECADDGMISVPERPAFAEKEARGAHGVQVGPVPLAVREERYENETRYKVRQPGQDPHVLPALATGAPLAMEVESRDCPQEPRFLEPRANVTVFAAGSMAVVLGRPIASIDWPSEGPWLAVVLERMR